MPATRPVRRRSILLAVVASFVIAASGALVAAGPTSAKSYASFLDAALSTVANGGAGTLLRAFDGTNAANSGSDGRVTVLLLGSDYRPTLSGERTDIVMVITINPKTRQMAAVSIPRDVARLPMPGGGTFKARVNTIFSAYRKSLGRAGALDKVRQIIAYTLQIEIDYYVLIRMTAFNSLTDNVGGYNVKIPTAVKDPKFWDDPRGPQGIYFPSSTAWWLKGNNTALCNGYYKTGQLSKPGARCDRAIVYVRTRKGTGNSDFKRQRRAQDVVAAAIRKVGQRGNGSNLTALFNAALAQRNAGSIDTNIPVSLSSALDFYALLNSATLTQQAVFKPTTYASRITGTSAYQLKLTPVRNLTKLWFAPVK